MAGTCLEPNKQQQLWRQQKKGASFISTQHGPAKLGPDQRTLATLQDENVVRWAA